VVTSQRNEERKYFFFEKKKQKTFVPSGARPLRQSGPKRAKVFWFFFQKRTASLHSGTKDFVGRFRHNDQIHRKKGADMRYALALGIMVGAATLAGSPAAQAAFAPMAAPVASAGHGDVQNVAYWWHGRRYWHRRWYPRRFVGGVWVAPGWRYY
jgi:hypothetical protein